MMEEDALNDPLMEFGRRPMEYIKPKDIAANQFVGWKASHFSTRLKLQGADYFLRQILGAASRPEDLSLPLLAFSLFHWYLDAFFFELISASDTLFQELKAVYCPDLPTTTPITTVQKEVMKSQSLPEDLREFIEQERKADWYEKLQWYRNTTAHVGHIPWGFEKGGSGDKPWHYNAEECKLFIQLIHNDEVQTEDVAGYRMYLDKMLDFVNTVWNMMKQ